jgi:NAD(P)-dependent dehydrogenase (short-subunit alcohol dehydrogenase family)
MNDYKSKPELAGQTVVVIGGSAGIGLETARHVRAQGADVILTGRNPERLERDAAELGRAKQFGLRRHRRGRSRSVLRAPAGAD